MSHQFQDNPVLSEHATTSVQNNPMTSKIRGSGSAIRRSVPDNVRYGSVEGYGITDSITQTRGATIKLPIRRSKNARHRKGISAMSSCSEELL